MRQKFIIKNNNPESELNIKEYGNLDREHKNNLLKSNQELLFSDRIFDRLY